MQKRWKQMLMACLLLAALLCGCGQSGETDVAAEPAGSGYFRDVNFGMTMEEVIAAEEGREDSGEPERYEQYSALMYDEITWNGYLCNLSYIFDSDGIHLDTILLEVLSGAEFDRIKQTLEALYTEGGSPEESNDEYFSWSSGEQVVLAQNNADGSAVIVFMLVPEADKGAEVPVEEASAS